MGKLERIRGKLFFRTNCDIICELQVVLDFSHIGFVSVREEAPMELSRYEITIKLTVNEFIHSPIGTMGDSLKHSFKKAQEEKVITEEEYYSITTSKAFFNIIRNLNLIHRGNNIEKIKIENEYYPIDCYFDSLV